MQQPVNVTVKHGDRLHLFLVKKYDAARLLLSVKSKRLDIRSRLTPF